MQHKELEALLKQDDAHWEQNLEAVKNHKKKFSDDIQAMLDRQQRELKEFLNKQ